MTSIYFNSPSPLSMVKDNQDQENHLFYIKTSQVSSSSCPIFLNSTQELEKEDHGREPSQHPKHQEDEAHGRFSMANGAPNCKQDNQDHGQCKNGSGPIKWMSSKMRLMRKMMNSDRSDKKVSENMQNSQPCEEEKNQSSSNYNTFNNTLRVCSDCNTTRTPLWRSGPRGPKSLCNACGIRQRKARRAMAAAAAGSRNLIASNTSMRGEVSEEKQSDGDQMTQYKKRCKIATARSQKKLRSEEFTLSLRENSAFHRVFPQDEKDAAILLMALSWGLIYS